MPEESASAHRHHGDDDSNSANGSAFSLLCSRADLELRCPLTCLIRLGPPQSQVDGIRRVGEVIVVSKEAEGLHQTSTDRALQHFSILQPAEGTRFRIRQTLLGRVGRPGWKARERTASLVVTKGLSTGRPTSDP